jgi:hypothetical protein
MSKIKCYKCKGRGGGYYTCWGIYPNINYEYVEIGDCEVCNGTGEIDQLIDDIVE